MDDSDAGATLGADSARGASVLGAGSAASTSLLGDAADVRVQMEAIKDRVERGPAWLKLGCLVACVAAVCCDTVAILSELIDLEPIQMINTAYAGAFALFGLALETQQAFRPLKRWVNVWAKVLNRTWGRGGLYIVTGGLHLAVRSTIGYALGFGLIAAGVASIVVSRVASRKLSGLHSRIIQGHTDDLVYVRQVFNRMDIGSTGYLSSAQLASVARELGSEFTSSELVAIFEFLDSDFDGKLSYEEFEKFWTGASVDSVAWDRIPVV